MEEATDIRRSPRRRVVWALVIGTCALVSVVLGVRFVADQIAPSCEWSDDERATVEAAPVSDFAGMNLQPGTAICDMSMPSELYVSYELPDGAALPADWYQRDVVGTWRAVQRFAASPGVHSGLVCYLSSDLEFSGVQVVVRGSGLIEASMSTRGVCVYGATQEQPRSNRDSSRPNCRSGPVVDGRNRRANWVALSHPDVEVHPVADCRVASGRPQ